MFTFLVFVFFYGCALSFVFDAVKGQVIEEADRGAIGNIKITRGWRARGIALVMSILLFVMPNLLFEERMAVDERFFKAQIDELFGGVIFGGIMIWQLRKIDAHKYNQRNSMLMERHPAVRAVRESLKKIR